MLPGLWIQLTAGLMQHIFAIFLAAEVCHDVPSTRHNQSSAMPIAVAFVVVIVVAVMPGPVVVVVVLNVVMTPGPVVVVIVVVVVVLAFLFFLIVGMIPLLAFLCHGRRC